MLFSRRETFALGLALTTSCLAATGCSSDSESDTDENAIEIDCTHDMAGAEVADVQAWIKAFVYDEDEQAAVMEKIEAAKNGQTLDAPLVVYNPFGTNTLSLYAYFTTEEAASVSYTVHAGKSKSTSVPDFTRAVNGGNAETTHEFQVIGLVPDATSTVTITASRDDGTTEQCVLSCKVGDLLGDEELQLDVTEGKSDVELAEGLYAVLGNDSTDADFMYYYDNDGFLRGEVPVIGYRSHRMLFDDEGTMYYSASQSKMAAMNALGQIVRVYHLGDYDLHHDYVWADEATMLVLATDTSRDDSDEDLVIALDVDTGAVSELVDMGELLPAYKEAAFAYHEANSEPDEDEEDDVPGWMHINSLQYLAAEDAVLLSSRETSTIFKVSGVVAGEPQLDYLLASELFWAGTDYEELVFAQVGDFTVHGGQHCLAYVEDDALEDGQYYLQFFNNNLGVSASTTNDFDYEDAGIGESGCSYYYVYLVDENEGTFALADSLEVPYSGYVSSVQWKDGNLIVDSGTQGLFTEYDADYNPIRTFSMGAEKFIYRVFKYDL